MIDEKSHNDETLQEYREMFVNFLKSDEGLRRDFWLDITLLEGRIEHEIPPLDFDPDLQMLLEGMSPWDQID